MFIGPSRLELRRLPLTSAEFAAGPLPGPPSHTCTLAADSGKAQDWISTGRRVWAIAAVLRLDSERVRPIFVQGVLCWAVQFLDSFLSHAFFQLPALFLFSA